MSKSDQADAAVRQKQTQGLPLFWSVKPSGNWGATSRWKRRRENPSLTEAAGSSGCAGVKLRQQMAFARSRQGSGDEGRGALWAGSLCGSD